MKVYSLTGLLYLQYHWSTVLAAFAPCKISNRVAPPSLQAFKAPIEESKSDTDDSSKSEKPLVPGVESNANANANANEISKDDSTQPNRASSNSMLFMKGEEIFQNGEEDEEGEEEDEEKEDQDLSTTDAATITRPFEDEILDTKILDSALPIAEQSEILLGDEVPVEKPEPMNKQKTNDSKSSSSLNTITSLGSFLLQRKQIEEDEIEKIISKSETFDESSNPDSAAEQEDVNATNPINISTLTEKISFDVALQKFASDAETTIASFLDTYNQGAVASGEDGKKQIKGKNVEKEKTMKLKLSKKEQKMLEMDQEQIREVDESISILTGSGSELGKKEVMKDIEILREIPSTITIQKPDMVGDVTLLPLSDPQHIARIELDMIRLSVSIASGIETVDQWKVFCNDGGGVLPLLQCIRDGAREVRQGPISLREDSYDESMIGLAEREVAFESACKACRTLRDLCVISKPFSAVITDGILRTDSVWATSKYSKDGNVEKLSGGLLSDLAVLLKHSADADRLYSRGDDSKTLQKLKNRGLDIMNNRRQRRISRQRCALYVVQLLLAMSFASDKAVDRLRATSGLTDTVLSCSSYAQKERLRRRWIRYPIEIIKRRFKPREPDEEMTEDPFLAAASVSTGLSGQIQGTSNQLLAAIGYNEWYPKTAGQRGLRILCLDGGGTRGITAISSMRSIVDALGGIEVCDAFDIIAGTSTGAIIAFLVGLRRESSVMARKRYDKLIKKIFVKSALSAPMLLLTTATYDESPFNQVMKSILKDNSMLASRADPRVPLVFAVSSNMSRTPTQLCLLRNYNYSGGEMKDSFVQDPIEAKEELDLPLKDDVYKMYGKYVYDDDLHSKTKTHASRHPGSFRVLQRAALRATTAAPTVFKPVLMGGELYCDGGIVASNPAAVAIHEARTIFPNVPIEMVVSCGTGAFIEEKSEPRIGWVSTHCKIYSPGFNFMSPTNHFALHSFRIYLGWNYRTNRQQCYGR